MSSPSTVPDANVATRINVAALLLITSQKLLSRVLLTESGKPVLDTFNLCRWCIRPRLALLSTYAQYLAHGSKNLPVLGAGRSKYAPPPPPHPPSPPLLEPAGLTAGPFKTGETFLPSQNPPRDVEIAEEGKRVSAGGCGKEESCAKLLHV